MRRRAAKQTMAVEPESLAAVSQALKGMSGREAAAAPRGLPARRGPWRGRGRGRREREGRRREEKGERGGRGGRRGGGKREGAANGNGDGGKKRQESQKKASPERCDLKFLPLRGPVYGSVVPYKGGFILLRWGRGQYALSFPVLQDFYVTTSRYPEQRLLAEGLTKGFGPKEPVRQKKI
ncbi:hypothetical protein NQZ68_022668 [Dissostichus eleginoides]|nr:hypothetical protein NQZ68_022668 [Dissostichus eleginoides]